MVNIILGLVIVGIIGAALWKVYSDKKKGNMCSGCPYSNVDTGECNMNEDKS